MYSITKQFSFSASHRLSGLPPDHKCGHIHGHNYVVIVELRAADLDDQGFVLDYGLMSDFGRFLDEELDHSHLCESPREAQAIKRALGTIRGDDVGQRVFVLGRPTTAENLAQELFFVILNRWPRWPLLSVTVKETDKTSAVFKGA